MEKDIKEVKFNIGCSNKKIDGYINTDIRREVNPDIVWDSRYQLDDNRYIGKVDLIYARHVLEHFTKEEAINVIKNWYDILKKGGTLHIIVPNIEFHAKQLLGMSKSNLNNQLEHAMAGFYGWDREETGGKYSRHLWGYTFGTLRHLLFSCGFLNIEVYKDGNDSEDWHLNVKAIK